MLTGLRISTDEVVRGERVWIFPTKQLHSLILCSFFGIRRVGIRQNGPEPFLGIESVSCISLRRAKLSLTVATYGRL